VLNVQFLIGTMASGIYEALELIDGASDYLGKGVLKVSSTSHGVIWYCLCLDVQCVFIVQI
jgi:enolase